MRRALMAGVLVAAVLMAGPAIDKKPRICAQPIAETTMDTENYAIRKAREAGITVAPCIKSFMAQPQRFRISGNFTGKNRILIGLLESNRDKAGAYALVYDELVSAIASAIRTKKAGDPDDFGDTDVAEREVSQEEFIKGLWNIMDSALCMEYEEDAHMFSMIKAGQFNCSTSSFLALDVARCIGVWAEIVSVDGHQFIKTSDFLFETTSGDYYPIEDIHDHYPVIYGSTSDLLTTFSTDYEELADDLSARGKNEKAVEYYSRAIERDSMNVSAYIGMGCAYSNLGKYRKAILNYDKVIRLDPTNVSAYFGLGCAYSNCGEYRKAILNYDKAICLGKGKGKKDLANYRFQRGRAYYLLGDYVLALGMIATIKPGEEEKERKNPLFYSRLAFADYVQTIRDCSAAIRLNPKEPSFYSQRADAYGKLGIKAKHDRDMGTADSLKRR